MTDRNSCRHNGDHREGGNAVVVTLIILIIGAVGAFAVMSGKIDVPGMNIESNKAESVASSDDAVDAEKVEENANPILARVEGNEIKRQDVLDFINTMPAQMRQIPPQQLFPMALEQLIGNQIVDKQVQGTDLANNEDVKEQIAVVTKQIIRTKFLEDAIAERTTDERIQAEYNKYLEKFPKVEEVRASHILVDDEKLSKSLINKLNKGEAFDVLAKENSKDGSAEQGGDLGYFAKEDVVPAFADAAFATEVGAYTKKPIKTEFGYHIILVKEKRDRPPAPIEQAKPYIEKELQRVILDEVVTAWKEEVEIERFDINGNPLPDQEPAAGEAETPAEDAPANAEENTDAE